MSPKISIIIPTYKPKDYIWTCLDSVCAQTMSPELWEVIVVLNGCKAPWLKDLQKYALSHPDISIHVIQTDSAGVSNARNIGIDKAKGEYITFIDDDDYVSPTYLEELYPLATPDTIAASYTNAFDDCRHNIPYYVSAQYKKYAEKGKLPFYIPQSYFSGPCMKLIHRDIIGKRRFDTRFVLGEDSLFMFAISNRMHYICFTSRNAIYYRRLRNNSASNSLTWIENFKNCYNLIKLYITIYRSDASYSFRFLVTRVLGGLHTMILNK